MPDDISENWLLISEFWNRISHIRILFSDFWFLIFNFWFLICDLRFLIFVSDFWILMTISRKDGLRADEFGFINEKSKLQESGFLDVRITKWVDRKTSWLVTASKWKSHWFWSMYYYVAFARLLTVRRRWATVDAPNSPYQPPFKKDKKQLYSALPLPLHSHSSHNP